MPRIDLPGIAQHVIQRGVNGCACFCSDDDRRFYLNSLEAAACAAGCEVHTYVLMTNHTHLLVTGKKSGSISAMMQDLGRTYVQYFNRQHRRTGTLWQGRFKSNLVASAAYVLNCYRYIELNPVRANMVARAGEYRWSSAQVNAHGKYGSLVRPHENYQALGVDPTSRAEAYLGLLNEAVSEEDVASIRAHVNQGKVLGSRLFQQQIEDIVGRSARLQTAGRPRKVRR